MSEQPDNPPGVPVFDVADRMRKALRHSGLGVQEMADYLGVARNSVSNWINGRFPPSTQTLRLWALKTGVSYGWLADVDDGPPPGIPTKGRGFRTAPTWGPSSLRTLPALAYRQAA